MIQSFQAANFWYAGIVLAEVFWESQVTDTEALHHGSSLDTIYNKLQVAHDQHDLVSEITHHISTKKIQKKREEKKKKGNPIKQQIN